MKRFINHRDRIVPEAIDGLLCSSAGAGLAHLDAGPGARVVLRDDADRGRVAIVSGGGSGHEPAHAGFVGPGMLSAAVCGEVFASPPVDAVLSAIMAVTGEPGCLVVIKNYTGDRLNFGLAAEQARAAGLRVETVVVGDDIALLDGDADRGKARGIAGTLFVHRIAGHLAEQGRPLEEVAAVARTVANEVMSIGLSLSPCDPYTGRTESRLSADQVELGLGIHGEPGAEIGALADADTLMARAADRLDAVLGAETRPLALLLNNLGTVPPLEMSLLVSALRRTALARRVELLVGPAPLMTALDMNGFSLSVLPLTEERRAALLAAPPTPAWPRARALAEPRTLSAPALPDALAATGSDDPAMRALVERAAAVLVAQEDAINDLDAKVGDGDAGTTFAQIGRTLRDTLPRLPLADPAALLRSLGGLLAARSGGSSGVLLSILFAAAGAEAANGKPVPAALRGGLDRMMALGGARPGDRTMVDALVPALDALVAGHALPAVATAARAGADATRSMNRARAGRAAYVPEASLRDVPDPGAEAIARLLETLARG
ncbi:dihydroxyacetone kinase subunit DhaK [Rhizosaccharibacter radicis]|uniref:Dihydroxyacetone kinase subunit DhaK n=1 Tax=Rhizosaccharibacter radicis TaxID=2782605 RepID=A0ABT1W190_9PROT|nr:dihydroxyacetone kinase subunit DhaK [Acetobacteraceae bacterium KSS12]